jgi:hypothetical protein
MTTKKNKSNKSAAAAAKVETPEVKTEEAPEAPVVETPEPAPEPVMDLSEALDLEASIEAQMAALRAKQEKVQKAKASAKTALLDSVTSALAGVEFHEPVTLIVNLTRPMGEDGERLKTGPATGLAISFGGAPKGRGKRTQVSTGAKSKSSKEDRLLPSAKVADWTEGDSFVGRGQFSQFTAKVVDGAFRIFDNGVRIYAEETLKTLSTAGRRCKAVFYGEEKACNGREFWATA